MGIILELEALFKTLEELQQIIDAVPLSPQLSAVRTKIDNVMALLKAAGI